MNKVGIIENWARVCFPLSGIVKFIETVAFHVSFKYYL